MSTLRLAVLLTAIAQFLFPFYVNPFREGHRALQLAESSQIVPAGYAFSIWGPIYLLAIAYAVWQLLPAGRRDPVTLRIAPYAIALYIGSSVWLTVAKFGPFWATIPLLVAMVWLASSALLIATQTDAETSARRWLVILPFGLYAGWTTCAMVVNIAEVAPGYGFTRFGLSVPAFGVVSLAVVLIIASAMIWRTRGALAYAATVIWALIAIFISAQRNGADPSITVATLSGCIAIIAVTGLTLWLRRNGDSRVVRRS